MASDIPGTDQRSSDSFSNALKVTQAAITATKQVYQAEDRTRHIEELALKAHGEVRRLRNVAQSLASTAVSVANMALDLCGYDSYRRAFREHPEYQDIVSYQDFVNLAAGQSSRSHKGVASLVPDPSHNGWLPNRQYDWLDEGRCYNQRRHRNNYPEEDKKWYYGPNGRDQEGQEMVLNSWDDTDDLVEPLSQQMKVRSKRPGSGRQYKQGPTYNEEEDFAAWCLKSPPENLLAVGFASGKVVLTSFGKPSSDPSALLGRELTPKHLAESLEKHRSDNSVQIWDLGAKSDGTAYTKPSYECGHAEPTSSLAWFRTQPKSLVTGQNNRFLRIFDLRETSRPRSVTFTKAVHGVQVDPRSDHRLASYIDNQALLWDTRSFEKPVLTLQVNKPISSLAWSPTRSNLLACLPKDSPVIKLCDIHGASDDFEPAVVERIIQPYRQENVSGFSWHPSHENKLLTISTSGKVKQLKVFEKIAVEDISKNGCLTDEPQLRNLWSWLFYAKAKLEVEQTEKNLRAFPRVQGIKSILKYDTPPSTNEGGNGTSRSELHFLSWQLTDGHRLRSQRKI